MMGPELNLEQLDGMAADLEAQAIAERQAQRALKEWAARRVIAKRIKARRRRLGQNGFSVHKMGFAKGKRGMQA